MRKFLVLGAGLSVLLGMTTLWALERSDVGVIRTTAADGTTRETRVWYVEDGERLLLEANTPRSPWYLNAMADPRVVFWFEGETASYLATPDTSDAAHDRIRSRMREKYGIRDTWIQLFAGYPDSVEVTLTPVGTP